MSYLHDSYTYANKNHTKEAFFMRYVLLLLTLPLLKSLSHKSAKSRVSAPYESCQYLGTSRKWFMVMTTISASTSRRMKEHRSRNALCWKINALDFSQKIRRGDFTNGSV